MAPRRCCGAVWASMVSMLIFSCCTKVTHLVPVDFIGVRQAHTGLPYAEEHQRVVLLNMQSQAQALAVGRTEEETRQLLLAEGLSKEHATQLAPHRSFAGNSPSSTVWMDQLTPYNLGALIALYEHKVFCQAAIWGINAYDQWGVELGKVLAKDIAPRLDSGDTTGLDGSTAGLLGMLRA